MLSRRIAWLSVPLLLAVVFMPLLVLPSLQHDDYNFFRVFDDSTFWFRHPQSLFMFYFGRPIQGIIGSAYTYIVHSPTDIAWLRLISITFLSASALLLIRFIYIPKTNWINRFEIWIAILLLPGAQFYVILGFLSQATIASFLALVASILFNRSSKNWPISAALILIALHTYQVSAMFFLIPVFANVLFSDFDRWPETRRLVIRSIGLMIACAIPYYLVHRFIVVPELLSSHPEGAHVIQSGIYEMSLSLDPIKKASFFINKLAYFALNLWNIYQDHILAAAVLLLIAFGCVRRLSLSGWQPALACCVLLLMANGPNLAVVGGYPAYRTLVPFSAMIVLLLVWALPRAAIHVFFVWAVISASVNVALVAGSNFLQFEYFGARAKEAIAKGATEIQVIRPKNTNISIFGLPVRNDEFGIYMVPSVYAYALRALGLKAKVIFQPKPGVPVIDMSRLKFPSPQSAR
jgi:hypothetical protein